MKRAKSLAVLSLTAILAAGCAAIPEPSSEASEQPVQSETAEETAAVTEAPTSKDAPTSAAADPLPDAEQELLEKEELARLQVEYEKKHPFYEENGGIMVEDAESWQDGYAQLLESGEAIYMKDDPPNYQPRLVYALLHIEDSDIPNLVITSEGSDVLLFRYEDGKVIFSGDSDVNPYNFSFSYRPYRGDIAYTFGRMMAGGVYVEFWHLGEDERYCSLSDGYEDTISAEIPPEVVDRFDVKLSIDEERGLTFCNLGSSWVTVSNYLSAGVFKPVTPDTIALLYNEEEGGTS